MSPVVKRKGERFTLPSKYLLFILTILCTVMMLVTFGTNVFNRPFNRVVGYVIVPFEQGIAKAGEWLSNRSDELVQIRTLLAENSALKEQVASLTEENTLLQQDKYELNELRGLLELDEEYGDYNKIGARIISRDSGNWYSSFVIDKGSNDGLADDMNVIAGGKMEIGLIFKIAAVGILVTILSQVLKHSGREEHAFLISLAGLILVLSWIVPYIYDLFDTVQTLFSF